MSFPDFNTVAALLLAYLLGWAAGAAWGLRRERAALERQWNQERQRVLRNTSLWHQKAQGQAQLRQGPEIPTGQAQPSRRGATEHD